MSSNKNNKEEYQLVQVSVCGQITLEGNLSTPKNAQGIVIFAHGSGSSRHSRRNKYVAQVLQNEGIATLLIGLQSSNVFPHTLQMNLVVKLSVILHYIITLLIINHHTFPFFSFFLLLLVFWPAVFI